MEKLFKNAWFVIPARQGSKGVKHKNRILLDYTIGQIPASLMKKVIITTDDDSICQRIEGTSIRVVRRPPELAGDEIDIKRVMLHVIKTLQLPETDNIIMLYLVWPERTFEKVEEIYKVYLSKQLDSLLCSTPSESHPYMTFYARSENRGVPVIKHDLYRRQDYPLCFVINHLVTVFRIGQICRLSSELYCSTTYFHPVEKLLNIDEPADLERFVSKQKEDS